MVYPKISSAILVATLLCEKDYSDKVARYINYDIPYMRCAIYYKSKVFFYDFEVTLLGETWTITTQFLSTTLIRPS